MDVLKDEVNVSFLSPSSCSELSDRRLSSDGAGGHAKLLSAALLDGGVEQVGGG